MPEIVVAQRCPEWYEARRGKITASLAAACLHLDPYKSAKAAWREIMGIDPGYRPNRAMQWGITYECQARLDYEAEQGVFVETTGFWVHPELPWLGASPDGLCGADGLAEIKCPLNARNRVPIHHRIQCLVQLAVTGRSWCDYYSWGVAGERFLRRVHRAGIPGLLVRLEAFYRAYVLTGIEPPRKGQQHVNATPIPPTDRAVPADAGR